MYYYHSLIVVMFTPHLPHTPPRSNRLLASSTSSNRSDAMFTSFQTFLRTTTIAFLFGVILCAHPISSFSDCLCDHINIQIEPSLRCNVFFCYQVSADGPTLCNTLSPGTSIQIPCPVYAAGVRLCDGSMFWIVANGGALPGPGYCSGTLQFETNCCGRICRVPDAAGCPVFAISPAQCVVPHC